MEKNTPGSIWELFVSAKIEKCKHVFNIVLLGPWLGLRCGGRARWGSRGVRFLLRAPCCTRPSGTMLNDTEKIRMAPALG